MSTGVYVHLPFCPYICPYCDFAKWPHKRSTAAQYLQALHAEIRSRTNRHVEHGSVFFGGGTPNTYAASDVADLLRRIGEAFPGPPGRETTIEINPELVPADAQPDFTLYRDAGVTRLSIGVQSFVPQEIGILGRRHTPADVAHAVSQARAAGIPSISIDLMFAVPDQTLQSWTQSLEAAIALEVDHISTYGLTIEAGTPYERWQAREPSRFFDDTREAELYARAIDTLEAHGYEQYEISNFARPGHRSVHNQNYWQNGEYTGLGVGAASYAGGVRSVHTRELQTYLEAATAGRPIPGEAESLQGAKRAGEAVMLALRTAQGVCLDAFKDRYELDFLAFYAPVVERYRTFGLLETSETHVRLTRNGRFVANDVCAAFVTFA